MTQEEREDFSQEKREKIEEATELIIEKVKANDIDGVKRIIKRTYEEGMEAVWPWLWVRGDVEFPFGMSYDNPEFLTEEDAVCLFDNDCDKEVEYIIESMVRPGDEEDDENEELDTAISEYLASAHLRNRYTGKDYYVKTASN